MTYEKSCGAIVIDDNKVLLVKHNAGHYGFPKGHVEGNETERETAIREVKEETGLDIEVDTNYRYMTTYSPKLGVSKDVIFFLGKVIGGEKKPQIEEVNEVLFVPLEEAHDLIDFDDMKEIYSKLLQDIKKN